MRIFTAFCKAFCIVALVFFLLLLLGSGLFHLLEVPFYLVTGWIVFLARNVPRIILEWDMIALAIITVIGLAYGTHSFCQWLYKSGGDDQPKNWQLRWTVMGLILFVCMFVTSIGFSGAVHQIKWLGDVNVIESRHFSAEMVIRRIQFSAIERGLIAYHVEHGELPDSLETAKKFFDDYILIDQWGNPILYTRYGNSYSLRSYGEDGVMGTFKPGGRDFVFVASLSEVSD